MEAPETVVDPTARDKYLLEVTVGPSYDPSAHKQVAVNSSEATRIESDIVTTWIKARIKGYNGLPYGSPTSSSYFDHSLHKSDRYSIGFSFVPKSDTSGSDLVMGFDYDHSIKHQLPPGFKYAVKIVTTFLDPGLYSDPYCDEPYVYGPALSSFFAFRIGERTDEITAEDQLDTLEKEADGVVEEGADGSGQAIREESGMPTQWKKRRKHYLDAKALANFTFEKGRMYHADFFNPYIDFANFALNLPGGFAIPVAKYIDDKTHHLRFVLKNRKTEEVYFVVLMTLLFGKELKQRLESEENPDRERTSSDVTDADAHLAEQPDHNSPNKTMSTEVSTSTKSLDQSTAESTNEEGEDQGHTSTDTATNAATSLAKSVYGVYAALGFAHPSSSSESEASSRVASPKPSEGSLQARIDDMDDSAVESSLQSRHTSAK